MYLRYLKEKTVEDHEFSYKKLIVQILLTSMNLKATFDQIVWRVKRDYPNVATRKDWKVIYILFYIK